MVGTSIIEGYVHNPKVEHTAAYKAFHYFFLCEVAEMHLMTKEFIAISGTVSTGDRELDRNMALQPRQCQLSIAAMAEFHSEGISINLVNPEDSLKIYQIIYDHLTDWNQKVLEQPNIKIPVEDLQKFDSLAAEVYKLAKYYWKEDPYHGRLQHFLTNRSRRGRIRIGNPKEHKTEHAAEHTPMTDAINAAMRKKDRPWR